MSLTLWLRDWGLVGVVKTTSGGILVSGKEVDLCPVGADSVPRLSRGPSVTRMVEGGSPPLRHLRDPGGRRRVSFSPPSPPRSRTVGSLGSRSLPRVSKVSTLCVGVESSDSCLSLISHSLRFLTSTRT